MASDCKGVVWCRSGRTTGDGEIASSLGIVGEGEELRGCYHFVKRSFLCQLIELTHDIISLTTLHPFLTSRESILPLFSQPLQARRASPDSRVSELFVLLHGMLFTNTQLDSFNATMARFVKLIIEGAEEKE